MATGSSLYQLEVKLPSEDGITRTQVIRLKGMEQLWYSERNGFPEQGNTELLYIATDEKKIYIWFENDYLALSGYADDVLSQLNELKAQLVGYNTHTHKFTPKGQIIGNAIGEISYTTTIVNSMISAGVLPTFEANYGDSTLTFVWSPGELPQAEPIEVISGLDYTLAQLIFEGEEAESGGPVWSEEEEPETPTYTGSYSITPSSTAQTLAVNGLLMTDDIVIEAIPYTETSYSYGTTVKIEQGSEISAYSLNETETIVYTGDCEITPSNKTQILAVNGLIMNSDIVIKAIPYSEKANDYGTTIEIGPESAVGTWKFNDVLTLDGYDDFYENGDPDGYVNFIDAEGNSYSRLIPSIDGASVEVTILAYTETFVYSNFRGWSDEKYKTITITDGDDIYDENLISFLKACATKQS